MIDPAQNGPVLANLVVALIAGMHTMNIYKISDASIRLCLYSLIAYYFWDVFSCSVDFKVHHISTMVLIVGILLNMDELFERNLLNMLGEMEISTIFLDLLFFFPENKPLQILFISTFVYYRIIKMWAFMYYYTYINNDEASIFLMIYTFVLFFVQVYWTKEIIKKCVEG
jgi:hypothetical protein